jgi:hypothetical protein
MAETWREARAAELRALQQRDPRSLINRYCEITGSVASGQLPHQTSFTRMIDTIVDHECRVPAGTSDILACSNDKNGQQAPPAAAPFQ